MDTFRKSTDFFKNCLSVIFSRIPSEIFPVIPAEIQNSYRNFSKVFFIYSSGNDWEYFHRLLLKFLQKLLQGFFLSWICLNTASRISWEIPSGIISESLPHIPAKILPVVTSEIHHGTLDNLFFTIFSTNPFRKSPVNYIKKSSTVFENSIRDSFRNLNELLEDHENIGFLHIFLQCFLQKFRILTQIYP